MLLTALATFLALGGAEILLYSSVDAGLTHLLGPAGSVLATLLFVTSPIVNLFVSWYAALRFHAWLWAAPADAAEDRPTRRRIAGQHQF
jgi:hypothetical protein